MDKFELGFMIEVIDDSLKKSKTALKDISNQSDDELSIEKLKSVLANVVGSMQGDLHYLKDQMIIEQEARKINKFWQFWK